MVLVLTYVAIAVIASMHPSALASQMKSNDQIISDDDGLIVEDTREGEGQNWSGGPRIRIQPEESEMNDEVPSKEDDSVIILSAVDGTLAGVSRSTGRVLWKQTQDVATSSSSSVEASVDHNKFLSPLVSTSGEADSQQWHAVPSIDGTVYLTDGVSAESNHELSTSSNIRDLVDRAPFVDSHGRFFVGSKRAMVAAVDERTGEILRVIPKFKAEDGDDEEELPPSLEGRDVVWIGRLEHMVTVHDLKRGIVDVDFSIAEILSVDEMIHGDRHNSEEQSSLLLQGERQSDENIEDLELGRLFTEYITEALRHPSAGRVLLLPAPGEDSERAPDSNNLHSDAHSNDPGQAIVISTPNGNVAFQDSTMEGWLSFDLLDSPAVYALEASTGRKIKVTLVQDVSDPSESSSNELTTPKVLEGQIASLELSTGPGQIIGNECGADDNSGLCRLQSPVVGSLSDGQMYALPIGIQQWRRKGLLGLPHPNSVAPEMADGNVNPYSQIKPYQNGAFHQDSNDDIDIGDGNQQLNIDSMRQCTPNSPLYPGCLVGASLIMSNLLDVDGNLDMASVFASSDLDYDLYLDMLGNNRKKSYFQTMMKLMTSWIAPTVALIFVVSFEFGRRERLKADAKNGQDDNYGEAVDSTASDASNKAGVIQLSDEILGYGGHGTIVYKGVLDKRQVAVKRLLNMYHASADREISLLIESDGHPNVVRYFLKETRGEFVYLALELCDMSLDELIASLGKLRPSRKRSIEDAVGLDEATKSLLFQIATGVRHIHSLRIVHRDLKPQNILLALKNKPKTADNGGITSDAPSDEIDAVRESFMNEGYIPKISDMGLGKQLAGQSSFGLSTLGTGSVGGDGRDDAGAGAGTVGWSAPEVLARRWSPDALASSDISESVLEVSPIDVASNARTSRSVDIFSLGCIFYSTLLPGLHPFGEWYEREANIMKNMVKKDDLDDVSPDAADLILCMISRDPRARPTAEQVCSHPYFWSAPRRLKFICELSDRLELCSASDEDRAKDLYPLEVLQIEKGASNVFGTTWDGMIDAGLIETSLNRRTYDFSSVRDCLRMIRNKHHHFDELPADLKSRIGSIDQYVFKALPRLLMHCYHFCIDNLHFRDSLASAYDLPIDSSRHQDLQGTNRATHPNSAPALEAIPDVFETEEVGVATSNPLGTVDGPESIEGEGVVVWWGSSTAKRVNVRGWYRSENEWAKPINQRPPKRNPNLVKNTEDPIFRTRLCNHFDASKGTFCQMRKKKRCVFAHGPAELRVKKGKIGRWGKLVDSDGLNFNPRASGGEDTYGAAKTIENTRKQQGEWGKNKKGTKPSPSKKFKSKS